MRIFKNDVTLDQLRQLQRVTGHRMYAFGEDWRGPVIDICDSGIVVNVNGVEFFDTWEVIETTARPIKVVNVKNITNPSREIYDFQKQYSYTVIEVDGYFEGGIRTFYFGSYVNDFCLRKDGLTIFVKPSWAIAMRMIAYDFNI
jgi:hypothetical protein